MKTKKCEHSDHDHIKGANTLGWNPTVHGAIFRRDHTGNVVDIFQMFMVVAFVNFQPIAEDKIF